MQNSPESSSSNSALLDFFDEKLGNLHTKIKQVPHVEETFMGQQLLVALKQLREEKEDLINFLNSGLDGFLILDEAGKTIFNPDAFEKQQLVTAQQIAEKVGKSIEDCILPEEATKLLISYFSMFIDVLYNEK